MIPRLEPDKRIPESLREDYAFLAGAVIETRGILDELTFLYGTDEMVSLLNEMAPAFFIRHQRLLVESIILSFSRLTDEIKTGRRGKRQENLTLTRLMHGLGDSHKRLRVDLQKKWTMIESDVVPMRLYRHKLLSHADRVQHLSPSTNLGQNITIGSMRKLLDQISEFLCAFDFFFSGVKTAYYPTAAYGDVDDLIVYVRLANEAEKKQNDERLR